jgi:DNA polymerase
MVIAPEGYQLVAADYSQIEPRVLAWLAGQQDVLDVFESGGDVYKYAYSRMADIPIEEVTKAQRQVGKIAVLSLGYQTGADSFMEQAAQRGVNLTLKECIKIVNDWRESNNKIKSFWRKIENCVMNTIATGQDDTTNGITTMIEGDFLKIKLPSGRKLSYYKPFLEKVTVKPKRSDPFERTSPGYLGAASGKGVRWGKVFTYGGSLTENITQAIARDLLVHSMWSFEAAGLEIVSSVHDEIIAQFPSGTWELHEILEVMNRKPQWAEGIPVVSDGFISTRYRK